MITVEASTMGRLSPNSQNLIAVATKDAGLEDV